MVVRRGHPVELGKQRVLLDLLLLGRLSVLLLVRAAGFLLGASRLVELLA